MTPFSLDGRRAGDEGGNGPLSFAVESLGGARFVTTPTYGARTLTPDPSPIEGEGR